MCVVSLSKQLLWLQTNRLSFMLKSWAESLWFMSAFHARAFPEAISNRHCIISVCEQPAVDGWSVVTVTNVLQLQLSPLRLPTMHSSSSPAFSLVPRPHGPMPIHLLRLSRHKDVQFSENIYAHLKFTIYGRKQTYTHVMQHSPASVGFTQAHPN